MKVLFLDVDGCLNRIGTHPKGLDSDKVEQLRWIVSATGCAIVLSSTWRKTQHQRERVRLMLEEIGATFAGSTPVLDRMVNGLWQAQPREVEIKAWIDENGGVSRFVILDDEALPALAPFHVRTDGAEGLTAAKAREVVAKFTA